MIDPPGNPQSDRLLVDVAGMDAVQRGKVMDLLEKQYANFPDWYEVLEEAL